MKTKLTLTVRKDIIEIAKRKAKVRGVSVSKLFEDVFSAPTKDSKKSSEQIAGENLLKFLEKQPVIEASNRPDKDLIKDRLKEKYG